MRIVLTVAALLSLAGCNRESELDREIRAARLRQKQYEALVNSEAYQQHITDELNKQTNGSYTGDLYQTTGPAFNASPWTTITPTKVGTMTTSFVGKSQGTLVYTVNGTNVTKNIMREVFATEPTCTFTSASRTAA